MPHWALIERGTGTTLPLMCASRINRSATIASREEYAAAYGAYPAWGKTACLIVGIGVPSRDDSERAKAVRDRFVAEALPKVQVLTAEEPKERY